MLWDRLFSRPLPVGSKAPEFRLKDQAGRDQRLSDYLGHWVVLFFYPKDGTFFCTKEACSFQAEFPRFTDEKVTVLGISTDSVESHQKFAEQHKLEFPLLSDEGGKTAAHYGVRLPGGMTNRVTFLINPEGFVADTLSWVNWFEYGAKVRERLAQLRAPGGA